MKIWIDGYEANVKQRLGSSQVAFELLKHLEKLDNKNNYTILLPSEPLEDLPKERTGWTYKILKPRRLWTRIALPLALYTSRQKPDLFFSPTHYIPRFSPVKRIVTIFDLAYLHFPEMFNKKDLWQLTNWTKFSIQNADHIITISNASKKDIISEYQQAGTSGFKIKSDKITVAYPGHSETFKPIDDKFRIKEVLDKYKINGLYIIYIGTIQPRKNLVRLIEAVARIEDLKIVVVGKTIGEGRQGWKFEEILNRPRELGIENRVKFTGFIPDSDLPYLLNGAEAFILPSLWEGFGIPAIDSMACGVPVLVSNVSSLPEVVGKAGLTFDPNSIDQIEQAIRTIMTDNKLRQKLAKISLEQAKKFSWGKMAKVVLKTFERVGNG